jgi:hypothetical protein
MLVAVLLVANVSQSETTDRPDTVSIVRLLAAPDKLRRKEVFVSGVLRVHDERERSALYLDAGSRDAEIAANGVLLPNLLRLQGIERMLPHGETLEALDGRYVRVLGTVELIDYPSAFAVELTEVRRLVGHPLITSVD